MASKVNLQKNCAPYPFLNTLTTVWYSSQTAPTKLKASLPSIRTAKGESPS